MNKNKLVVAYGFEYDKVIINDFDCFIGRSLHGNRPVYCSLMIADKNINTIITKIKLIENLREQYLVDIDKLARRKDTVPKWQLVFCNKDYEYYIHVLQGKIVNYNSELNPCF